MRFSLIICTYKRPLALQRLLQTVVFQSLQPSEVIIVDGDETDDVAIMLRQFQNLPLQYIQVDKEERGLTKQRNKGIAASTTDVICFLDDDILLEADYFEKLLQVYAEKPDAIGVGGYITNEVKWEKVTDTTYTNNPHYYVIDGFARKESSRNKLRKIVGWHSSLPPGFAPEFGHGLSVSYLPPSGKTYSVHYFMGGVSSFKKSLFSALLFDTYYEGYGLYEDADFCLRASKIGALYVTTQARLSHHHDASGRPNAYRYGKMVVKNGHKVWRIAHPHPSLKNRFKWHGITCLLMALRLLNVLTTSHKKTSWQEFLGRITAWWQLVVKK